MFDNNNLPINNNSGVYNPDVWTHGISPHHITEYINQMSNISINIVNYYNKSLSILEIQYIGYFYYVFPLHLNTYNRLFSDIIHPKLLKLKKGVGEFTDLRCDINSFIESLNGVSKYLIKFNPPQKLLELIRHFNGDTYADGVKSHLEQLIDNLIGLDVNNKYEQIIENLHSLARQYNHLLSVHYQNFKKNIGEHKKSLETNIKQYIFYIRYDLSYIILPLISMLISDIKNLEENNRNLSQFDKYKEPEQLKKGCTKWEEVGTQLEKIIKAHTEYKNCLQSCSDTTKELTEFIKDLNTYHYYIYRSAKIIKQYQKGINDTNIIDQILDKLQDFKPRLDNFDTYLSCVQKLEEIGKQINEHIKTMKSALEQVKDQVDDGAKSYILGLKEITIKKEDVQKIKTIKSVNDSVINRLKIAKHTIQFYNSLQGEISKLNDVNFTSYDIPEFLKNSSEIKEKLRSFETTISQALSKISRELNKVKSNLFPDLHKNYYIQVYTSDIPRINNIINIISQILDLECAIEGVSRNLIRCSTKQLSMNIGVLDINKILVGVYSIFNVMDYNVVVNRLLESSKKIDQILELTIKVYMCRCIYRLQWIGMDLSSLKVKNIMDKMTKDELDGFLKLDKIREITRLGMTGNHMCLCMVIKYLLYPKMINIIQILGTDLQTLSTLSRKFTNYTHTTPEGFQIVKIFILVIDILDSMSKWVNKNYYVEWTVWADGVEIECYCRYYRHRRYYTVITIILYLSSLIENMWSMDTQTMKLSIEKLSSLMSESEGISSDNTHYASGEPVYKNIQNFRIFSHFTSITRLYLKDLDIEMSKKLIKIWSSFFKSIIPSLSIMEYFQLSTVAYSIISSLSFYIIANPLLIIKSIPTILKTALMSISVTYLKSCKEPCTCPEKKGFKICIVGKIIYFSLNITLNTVRYALGTMIKHIFVDILKLEANLKIEFVRNVCVNANIELLLLLKNNSINTSSGYPDSNIGLKDISIRNWGYNTHFEHSITTPNSFSEGYPHITKPNPHRLGTRNKMFKLVLSRLLTATIVVFMFIYVRATYNQFITIGSRQDSYSDSSENVDKNITENTNIGSSSYLVDKFLNTPSHYGSNVSDKYQTISNNKNVINL